MTPTSSVRSVASRSSTRVSSTSKGPLLYCGGVCPCLVLPSGPGISMPRTALRRIIRSWTSCTITYRSADSTNPWRIPDETPKGVPRWPLVFTAVLMSVYMVLTPCMKTSGRPKGPEAAQHEGPLHAIEGLLVRGSLRLPAGARRFPCVTSSAKIQKRGLI
jgi:hypothetical protein